MELVNIEKLLDKYFEGETTLSEEKELRTYFTREHIPSHLEKYKDMFQYFSNESQITSIHIDNAVSSTNIPWYTWLGVAASIVLIVGLFMTNIIPGMDTEQTPLLTLEQDLGTYEDPQLALQKTKEVLNLVSQFMNEGKKDLVYLNEFENAKKKLVYLNEFENTKNSLIK